MLRIKKNATNKVKVLSLQQLRQVSGGRSVDPNEDPNAWSTSSNSCGTVGADEWSTWSNGCPRGSS